MYRRNDSSRGMKMDDFERGQEKMYKDGGKAYLVIELHQLKAERDAWIDTAAQFQRNVDYYRELVVRCGKAIGIEAYLQDDGGMSDDVLCDKVPELVECIVADRNTLIKLLDYVTLC
jgi:hypothetical protein